MNIVNHLQDRFDAFIDETNVDYFYKGLQSYIDWVKLQPSFIPLTNRLQEEKEDFYSQMKNLDSRTFIELDESREQLVQIIKKNKIKIPSVTSLWKEMESYDGGRLTIYKDGYPFKRNPFCIAERLFDICCLLKDHGLGNLVSQFEDKENRVNNLRGNYVFSDVYFELGAEQKRTCQIRETQTWDMWGDLNILQYSGKNQWNSMPEVVKRLRWQAKQVHLYFKENCQTVSGIIGNKNAKDLIPSNYKKFELYESRTMLWDGEPAKLGVNTFKYIKQLLKAYPKRLNPSQFHDFGDASKKTFPKHLRDIRRDCVKEIARKFKRKEEHVKPIFFPEGKNHTGEHRLN